MHKLLLSLIAVFVLLGCEVLERTPEEITNEPETLTLSIPFSQESQFAEIAQSASIVVSFNNVVVLEKELTLTDSTVQGTIDNLIANRSYNFTLSILDKDGNIAYEGEASASIIAGKDVNVNIVLYATTGNAIINGTIEDGDSDENTENLQEVLLKLTSTQGIIDLCQKSNLTYEGVETTFPSDDTETHALLIDQSSHLEIDGDFNFGMDDYSISFDIKAPLQDGAILSKYRGGVGSPETGWNIQCENSGGSSYRTGVRFDISDGSNGKWGVLASGASALDNEWHSILITVNRIDGIASMYLDGTLVDQANISNFGLTDNASNIFVGWRGDYWFHMDGYLKNVNIFSQLVSVEDVDTLIGDLLSIDVNEGIVVDKSERMLSIQNDGVAITPLNTTPVETAFIFDSEDYISCNNPELFNIGTGDFTIKFSIKSELHDAPIMSKYRGGVGAPENGWNVQIEYGEGALGGVEVYREGIRFDISDGQNGNWGILASGRDALDNKWHDVEIIYNRSEGVASMKVDNLEVDHADISNFLSVSNDADLMLGWRGDSWNHFNGAIDDIQIMNYVE